MNVMTDTENFARYSEHNTLTLQRLLPGPIERVWDYLTRSELRRQWLAAGEMPTEAGAAFTLTWRNDELTSPPGDKPAEFGSEHSMESRITEIDPPHRLSVAWNGSGDVTFALEPHGDEVMLTVTHRDARDRSQMLGVSTGWHAHLDTLAAKLRGETPTPFWDAFVPLRAAYERRVPA